MLKPYVGYFRGAGAGKGAVLIFAHTAEEAKKVGWRCSTLRNEICDDDYLDMAVRLLKGKHLFLNADRIKLARDTAHVIDEPTRCKLCGWWEGPIDAEGVCLSCVQEAEANR